MRQSYYPKQSTVHAHVCSVVLTQDAGAVVLLDVAI